MSSTSFRRMLRHTPMRDLIRGRITGRLDIDQLLDETGLSGQAADKVRRVVKYTRLWRLEKVDVASELIAHFTDGQEAGVPLEELVEQFGNERQTAKLIRRAKKRQRPVPWHVFAWARLCVLVFFGVYTLTALFLLTGSPSVTTDYLAILNQKAAAVPEDEAAWPIYREALVEMGYSQHKDRHGFTIKESAQPGEEGWPEKLAFIKEHAEQLAKVRQAANMPSLGYHVGFVTTPEDEAIFEPSDLSTYTFKGPHPPLFGVLLQNLAPLRALSRLLAADTTRAIEAGEGGTAFDNIVAILGVARHADDHPLLINGLVRLSIENLAYRSIQETLSTRPDLWSDEQLRNLAHRIAAIEYSQEDWYNGERLWFYDYLQRAYTDDGRGGGRLTSDGIDAATMYNGGPLSIPPSTARSVTVAAGLPVLAAFTAPRDEMREMYDELMDQTIIESRNPLWFDTAKRSVEEKIVDLDSEFRTQIRYNLILSLLPSALAVNRTIQTQEGYRDGVLVGIALMLYQRVHGEYPETLDALVPTYLPALPVDRLTGEPVKYLVDEDGPVVYSVGVDGDDDGCRPPVDKNNETTNDMASPKQFTGEILTHEEYDGDWVLWPVPYK